MFSRFLSFHVLLQYYSISTFAASTCLGLVDWEAKYAVGDMGGAQWFRWVNLDEETLQGPITLVLVV